MWDKLKDKRTLSFFMVMSVVSFLGFVVENVWMIYIKGYINNRNVTFPFLFGYGLGLAFIYLLFGTPKNVLWLGKKVHIENKIARVAIYFLVVMICVSLGEIVIGTVVEKTCGFYWWSYKKLPLHITRYTTIPTSALFAALICVFMNYCLHPLLDFFSRWNYKILFVTANLLMILMIADLFYMMYYFYRNRGIRVLWKIPLREVK